MKLSPDTLNVLKNFASINQSILFPTEGSMLSTVDESKSIVAQAKITEEFAKEFGIYDLNEFLSTVALFADPSLTVNEEFIAIKDDVQTSRATSKYFVADTSMIPETPDVTKILKAIKDSEIEFDLSEDDLLALQKAAGTLQSPNIAVESDGKKVLISVMNAKVNNTNSYSIEVGKGTGAKFKMIYNTQDFKLLKGGYSVKISKMKISQFKHQTLDLTYFIALDDSSVYKD